MRTKTILFLAANPATSQRLGLDHEAREIEAKFRASEHREVLTLRTRWAVRPDDLLQALLEDRPTVVHFSGHGWESEGLVLECEGGQDSQVSPDTQDSPVSADAQHTLVSADALRRLFMTLKDDIRVVVLNACYSEEQAQAIAEVIDCVIGMRRSVGDRAATVFAAAFYRGLGFGRSVRNAFEQGLTAIALEGLADDDVPVLLEKEGVDAGEVILVGGRVKPEAKARSELAGVEPATREFVAPAGLEQLHVSLHHSKESERRVRERSETEFPTHPVASSANPFGDQGPITDSARFFDRPALLRQIYEELGKGSNLSLIGDPRVGKSSVLSMICTHGTTCVPGDDLEFVYIDMQWLDDDDEDFFAALCRSLGLPTVRGQDLYYRIKNRRVVMCLDEVDKMTWDGFTRQVRSQLRGLCNGKAAPLRLVVASRQPLSEVFGRAGQDSPLEGICKQLVVPEFSESTSYAFLHERLQGSGVMFNRHLMRSIYLQSGGNPALLQECASRAFETASKDIERAR